MERKGMIDTRTVFTVVFCLVFLLVVNMPAAAADTAKKKYKEIDVGAGELGIYAKVIEGGPITFDQVKTDKHPEYARGMVCVECHQMKFDAVTSSTRVILKNHRNLSNENVWKKITAFLPGRERFVLTTVYNNAPTATTVDMVLNTDEKVFYVLCEKGTEKLIHIQKNPRVCATRHMGWTLAEAQAGKKPKKQWMSVQVHGTAEVISPEDSRFEPVIQKYKPVRLTLQRAKLRFDTLRITPERIIYFDTNLYEEKAGVYQEWKRSP